MKSYKNLKLIILKPFNFINKIKNLLTFLNIFNIYVPFFNVVLNIYQTKLNSFLITEKIDKNKIKFTTNFILKSKRIPLTMDLNTWGKEIHSNNNVKIINKKKNIELFYKIYKKNNLVNYIELKKDKDIILLKFTDTRKDDNNLNTFTRTTSQYTYYFFNGLYIFKKRNKI